MIGPLGRFVLLRLLIFHYCSFLVIFRSGKTTVSCNVRKNLRSTFISTSSGKKAASWCNYRFQMTIDESKAWFSCFYVAAMYVAYV